MRKYAVEFLGAFFLVLTYGSTAVLGTAGPLAALAVGAMLMVMVYAGGHISGGHYNPVVTLAVFIRGRCEGRSVGPYILAQLLGAALAAFVVGKIFAPAVLAAGEGVDSFAFGKAGAAAAAVAAELLFTFALVYVVLNVTSSRETGGNSYYGLAVGFTMAAGVFAAEGISLGALNPAISTALCLTGRLAWADCWIHFLPQILGGVLAAFTFKGLNPKDV
jgi:aquaporin Z